MWHRDACMCIHSRHGHTNYLEIVPTSRDHHAGRRTDRVSSWSRMSQVLIRLLGGDSANSKNPLPTGRLPQQWLAILPQCLRGAQPSCFILLSKTPSHLLLCTMSPSDPLFCPSPQITPQSCQLQCPYPMLGSPAPQLGQPCPILMKEGATLSGFTLGCVDH